MRKKNPPLALLSLLLISGLLPLNVYAQSAVLYFLPSSGAHAEGETFWVSMMVDTKGASVNALAAYFDYPEDKLEPLGVDTSGSALNFLAEKNAKNGKVEISGGLPTPGFSGIKKISSVGFRVKSSSGSATFKFGDDSAVLTDAENKNILSIANSGRGFYTFKPAVVSPPAQSQPTPKQEPEPETQIQPASPAPAEIEQEEPSLPQSGFKYQTIITILDYYTIKPIEGANVAFKSLPETSAATDREGRAVFGDLPLGEQQISVNYKNYSSDYNIHISGEDGQETPLLFQLPPKSNRTIWWSAIALTAILAALATFWGIKYFRKKKLSIPE